MFKRWFIKISRYLFRRKYIRIMAGPLKGYWWTTGSSYEYILGNYEDPQTMGTFCSWLKQDTVFYDLGANVGWYSMVAGKIINAGKIYAFEPMPMVRSLFEKHVELNKQQMTSNCIEILPFGISDKSKQLVFSNDINQRDGNTYISSSKNFVRASQTMMVACFSIDELLEQGYKVPDVMKIDVEGAEYDVLQGAVNTLTAHRPNILLATHDCHLPGVREKCISFLEGLGYSLTNTGQFTKMIEGLDDYIAIHISKL